MVHAERVKRCSKFQTACQYFYSPVRVWIFQHRFFGSKFVINYRRLFSVSVFIIFNWITIANFFETGFGVHILPDDESINARFSLASHLPILLFSGYLMSIVVEYVRNLSPHHWECYKYYSPKCTVSWKRITL